MELGDRYPAAAATPNLPTADTPAHARKQKEKAKAKTERNTTEAHDAAAPSTSSCFLPFF
jgi:hypothetical protein